MTNTEPTMTDPTTEPVDETPRTMFRVPVDRLERRRDQIEKLNRRARKVGCA